MAHMQVLFPENLFIYFSVSSVIVHINFSVTQNLFLCENITYRLIAGKRLGHSLYSLFFLKADPEG